MIVRHAVTDDIDAIAELERICFIPTEAASRERMEDRVLHYPEWIWLGFEGPQLIGFVMGLRSDDRDLSDEMYATSAKHEPEGAWFHVLSVATLPEFQRQGIAATLMEEALQACREEGLAGSVLTCKERLVRYYARFGYEDEGISDSEHGGIQWHQMRICF